MSNYPARSIRKFVLGLGLAIALCALHGNAAATNMTDIEFDPVTDILSVTIAYRGTHKNHEFSVSWGECRPLDDDRSQTYGLLLDNAGSDRALEEFETVMKIPMSTLACRPARVTIRTAEGFNRTIDIPLPKKALQPRAPR